MQLIFAISVMAAVAVRKKVVSIGHFLPRFYLQSIQIFVFIRLNQDLHPTKRVPEKNDSYKNALAEKG